MWEAFKMNPAFTAGAEINNTLVMQLAMMLMLISSCEPVKKLKPILPEATTGRQVVNFNCDWKFAKGGHPGAEAPNFDDSAFKAVRLPHDWAISGPFNPREDGYAGKLPFRGVGWYRKTFTLNNANKGRRVYFDFDGVMAFPKVYVNGRLAGEWNYGYMSFRVDATKYVKFGGNNVIAVRVDTTRHGTRWYPGAGIYRKVTMTICEPVHIAHWGTFVTTPEVSDDSATVHVQTTVENHLHKNLKVDVEVILLNPDGIQVAAGKKNDIVLARGLSELDQSLAVTNHQRWDITSPKLYKAKVIVRRGDKVVDTNVTTFGIRTFKFTADNGFHLNGRRVQLHGVCLHHDQGPLGAAFYTRAMERQLEIMRDMGVNAIRTSHNPSAPELLDLCDRMGFVVWDECFDKWDATADRIRGGPPLEEHGEKQLRNFVMRDRNHASVVIWSIGNEIGNMPRNRQGKSPERVKFMSDFVRKYDPTRPVGMACNVPETADQPILDALDLTGWNYGRRYGLYRERYPDKPIIYSESASALSTRGFYELPFPEIKTQYSKKTQVDSYDLNAAPWADIPDTEFQLLENDSFVAGEFVWTGIDYLGEPTPFSSKARSSYFGIVDLCGIPKDRFYLYRSYWRPDVTTIHILPHWNWPDRVGKNVPVFVYTNGDSAELSLNGKSLGRRTKGELPEKPVNFAQGKLTSASSSQSNMGNIAANASDADSITRWCAADGNAEQWWQVDLGEVQPIRYLGINFEWEARKYGYKIKISGDQSTWQTIATKSTSMQRNSRWSFHEVDVQARYVRIEFTELQDGVWASIREFVAYPEKVESDYYAVTYKYRLRWNDVIYEPGELKAVAYKDGKEIGRAVMRTADKPAKIRLTPDRAKLSASGEDLCYILVEALDEKGTLCPLADNLIHFKVDGPAEIAGVGNGNPLSLEPFQAGSRKLFYGKAMLILRTTEGQGGKVRVTAESDGLTSAEVTVRCLSTVAYTADWESLKKHNPAPDWFRDAKFGIYFHWGVYSVPAFANEWYPRNMHNKGSREYKHHVQKYGEPTEFGYHDFVPMFKAEKFDADEWAELFEKAGARFAGLVAEHHDGFSMWDSNLTPWNAMDAGPKRDITGELARAIRKRGMRFVTTFHHARNNLYQIERGNTRRWTGHFQFVKKYFPSLLEEPKQAILYGYVPRERFLEMWKGKLIEVIDKYQPDLMYFDSWLNEIPDEYKMDYLAYYFNKANQLGKEVIVTFKQTDLPREVGVEDYEKGRANRLTKFVWLTDDTVSRGSWCYTEDLKIKSTSELLHTLIDIVSKNGQLMLNISPKADGTIPNNQKQVLLSIGEWLEKYGEAIYETRPFVDFGEGPVRLRTGGQFVKMEGGYTAQDIRYTRRGDTIYAIVLGWPGENKQVVMTMFGKANKAEAIMVIDVSMLGTEEDIEWQRQDTCLVVTTPEKKIDDIAIVFKISTSG